MIKDCLLLYINDKRLLISELFISKQEKPAAVELRD